MATPRLSTLNPVDLVALFQEESYRPFIGLAQTSGEPLRPIYLSHERPNTDLLGLEGIEVVIERYEASEERALLDGRKSQQRALVLHTAGYGRSIAHFYGHLVAEFGRENVSKTTLDGAGYIAAIGDQTGPGYITSITEAATVKILVGQPRYLGEARDVVDAPSDGNEYARLNGAWVISGAGGVDLNGYVQDAQLETRIERADGGYEFTGGFSDRLAGQAATTDIGSFVSYPAELVGDEDNPGTWLRFGFSEAANAANDNQYWGETDPNYDSTKGLFGGLHMPAGVTKLFDFGYSDPTGYSAAQTTGSLRYTAAEGSIDFRDCRPGDLALVRFDFNVIPQVANTTLEVAMIFATRNANDEITYTFPLTGEPIFYGTGTVGKTYLNRPTLSAYFASAEDTNARALLAVRSDNPILVAPLTTLVTLVR